MSTTASRVIVCGLGPADSRYLSAEVVALLSGDNVVLRTRVHPAADAFPDAASFDSHYELAERFDDVYAAIVEDLVTMGAETPVIYAVPGSPLIAEHTVDLLRNDPRVDLEIIPALSFLDLAWARLGVDPLAARVTLVDGQQFDELALGRGPFLVAQVWSEELLADLAAGCAIDDEADTLMVTVLHHLGLDDEVVVTVAWSALTTTIVPDHLTSLYIATLPSAAEQFDELVAVVEQLRRECPWDQDQTHESLGRHLLEESYEVLDAIGELDGPDGDVHLEEELGDLVVQVLFHAVIAAERGAFDLEGVLAGVEKKLIDRHPHVFGDVDASTKEEVAANWEVIKRTEKRRDSVTDGIPNGLPALALATKLQRKAQAISVPTESVDHARTQILNRVGSLTPLTNSSLESTTGTNSSMFGEILFDLCRLAQTNGVDPEQALREVALTFAAEIRAFEATTE